MVIKNIVFDVDGTLIDTEKAYMNALLDVLNKKRGGDYTYQEVVQLYGLPAKQGLQQMGFKDQEIPQLLKEWFATFDHYQDLVRVFPGIVNALQTLQHYSVKLSVVTSKSQKELAADFTPRGLMPYFDYIVTSSDTKVHKPKPDPLLKMVEISKIPAAETLYVGDTVYDLQCAHGAKAQFGLAGWGAHNHGQFQTIDYLFSRPTEIIDLIR